MGNTHINEINSSKILETKLIYRGIAHVAYTSLSSTTRNPAVTSTKIYRGVKHNRLDEPLIDFKCFQSRNPALVYRGIVRHNFATTMVEREHLLRQKHEHLYTNAILDTC